MSARRTRLKIYARTTGKSRYFFNTEEGTVRACAYWMIMRPKDIRKLFASSGRRFKGFRVDGSTRTETLTKLMMVSSLGFRVRTDNLDIVDPLEDGTGFFRTNYIIARDAIAREGGPEAIDTRKLVMWKHRTYFQAISTLQLYAGNFREVTRGLEEVPDVPGWLLTGMEHMRKGIESVSTQKAIQVAVGACDQELEAEKRGYEEELRKRDKQIDAMTQTIADMTRRDQMVAAEVKRAAPALPPRDPAPPLLPPREPPAAPPAPAILAQNISAGRSAVKKSVSDQKADENASQRVQRKGARSTDAFLAEVRRGKPLKPVSPTTTTKADKISNTLADMLAGAMDARRAQLAEDDKEEGDEEEDWEYGGKRAGLEIGAMLYPLSSPRVRGGNQWRNKMNDVFTT